jgi:hypothetical protein
MFAKPIAGKYSLSVVSADRYDPSTDEVLLLGGDARPSRTWLLISPAAQDT